MKKRQRETEQERRRLRSQDTVVITEEKRLKLSVQLQRGSPNHSDTEERGGVVAVVQSECRQYFGAPTQADVYISTLWDASYPATDTKAVEDDADFIV